MKKKIALVTGITGQDGAYLSKLLLNHDYKVYGAYRRSSSLNPWRLDELGILDPIDLVPFELLEKSNIERIIKKIKPDEIYNFAAQSYVAVSFENPIYTAETDAIGTLRILESIRMINKRIKFYQASSSEMLQKCELGIYDELSLARGLSPQRRQAFFQQNDSGLMQVKPDVRRMVSFRSLNLLSSYAALGRFDIVFCRNVLIYFSAEVKQRILQQIAGQLQPQGVLFLGASESISAASDTYSMVKCHPGLYYQKK
nr:GDP-mannose 4,6-dehydratase [Alteromonas macleodii]